MGGGGPRALYLEPLLSHKDDQSQLEEPLSFLFKVGEEVSKSLLCPDLLYETHIIAKDSESQRE